MPGGTAPTQVVERAFSEASLRWAAANIDGDQARYLALPNGFGDCALMEVSVQCDSITTMLSSQDTRGPSCGLFDDATTAVPVDVQFSGRWTVTPGGALHSHVSPDQVQFWKESEVLRVAFAEVDTNATPTADLTVLAKVRRLRPLLDRNPEDQHFFLTS